MTKMNVILDQNDRYGPKGPLFEMHTNAQNDRCPKTKNNGHFGIK